MIRLVLFAALATMSIPILVPQQFAGEPFPGLWVPFLLIVGEALVSAMVLKVIYPGNDYIRCLWFGIGLLVIRMLLCLVGSLFDSRIDAVRADVSSGVGGLFYVAMIYMYPRYWWVAGAQYVALLLWVPILLEMALPGFFPPRRLPAKAAAAGVVEKASVAPAPAGPPKAKMPIVTPKTFRELEDDLRRFPNLLEWMLFAPDRLPMWGSGSGAEMLEVAPEILHRMGEVCEPLLRPDWGRVVQQGMFQTDTGYCLLTTLPGNFLFASLWSTEVGEGGPPRDVLGEVLAYTEQMLHYRFGDLR